MTTVAPRSRSLKSWTPTLRDGAKPSPRQQEAIGKLAGLVESLPEIRHDAEKLSRAYSRILRLEVRLMHVVDCDSTRARILEVLHGRQMAEIRRVEKMLPKDDRLRFYFMKHLINLDSSEVSFYVDGSATLQAAPGRIATDVAKSLRLLADKLIANAERLESSK